jgi:hypothetical protein
VSRRWAGLSNGISLGYGMRRGVATVNSGFVVRILVG